MLNLSHNFYLVDGPKQILDKLDEYAKGNKVIFDGKDYSGIVAYLEWLEELAVILNQNLIDFAFIDDFFHIDSF